MGIFGWSYPPGCSGPPDEYEGPCQVCGEPVDACVCPECPVCGCQGDPACYPTHGLELTDEQREHAAMAAQRDRQAREDAEAEAAAWAAEANRDQEY